MILFMYCIINALHNPAFKRDAAKSAAPLNVMLEQVQFVSMKLNYFRPDSD